jgi:ABC-2 type transport system ATP-binding protein
MNNVIETHGLKRTFGATDAVDNLTLTVPEGSIYAFLGPNGAGKTTTIKMLMNILEPTAGAAKVLGVESTSLGPREFMQIGYVSENQQLPEWMTVAQLIEY